MRFPSKFRKFLPLLAIILLFNGSGFLCPLLDQTPAEEAAATAYAKVYCAPFKVTSVNGLPYGPVTFSWTKMSHGNPAEAYGYFYVLNFYGIPADPKLPAESMINPTYVIDPAASVTVPLHAAAKSKPYGYFGSYLVTLDFGYSTLAYPKNPDAYDFRIDCSTSLEIKPTPPQPRKVVVNTATPTAQPTAQPTATQTHVPTQASKPANTPTAALATACPAGQVGNPSLGIMCITVPK